MRLPYEPPDIALLGTVKDLTQAAVLQPGADNVLGLGQLKLDSPMTS